jgi:hypothetical protein
MSNLITEDNDRIIVSALGVEMDKHLQIGNKTNLDSSILLGNGAITKELASQGYVATLCAGYGENPKIGYYCTQDLHATRKQLEDLRSSIDFFLKRYPDNSIAQEDCADDNSQDALGLIFMKLIERIRSHQSDTFAGVNEKAATLMAKYLINAIDSVAIDTAYHDFANLESQIDAAISNDIPMMY